MSRDLHAMLAHIATGSMFTFADLHTIGDRVVGRECSYRWADALLQRERKAGRIEQPAKRGQWRVKAEAPRHAS